MDLDALTAKMVRRFGPGVRPWCAELPGRLARLARRWSLTPREPFPSGASAVTFPCGRSVLKMSPDHGFIAEQARTLGLFAPTGRVVGVLDADPAEGALLLEAIHPGTPCHDDPPTPAEFGALLRDLHAVGVPAGWPRSLRAGIDEFFPRFRARVTWSSPVTAAHLDRARDRCAALLDTQDRLVLLHGDLHLGNLLHGPPGRRHVLIDPKSCVGDPAFDTVDHVLSAAGRTDLAAHARQVAEAAGLDPGRVLDWSRALAPLIALTPVTPAAVHALLAFAGPP